MKQLQKTELQIQEHLSLNDIGLRGHVTMHRRNKITGETSLWHESDNIIPISGYQWLLMKAFGLRLDSLRSVPFEELDKDTNLITPDLNENSSPALGIGVDPNNYTTMEEDISDNHFIQGFMVGNGGSGEDNITVKNTSYSFVNLRNPIPFRQTQAASDINPPLLPASVAGKYLGVRRQTGSSSLFIKRFDDRPNIIHSWWRDGQRWDRVDPIVRDDLGPNAMVPPRNNRIETYCNINFTIDSDDCQSYFAHEGSSQTPMINELGLVAFDVLPGRRSTLERTYHRYITRFIELVMDAHGRSLNPQLWNDEVRHLSRIIDAVLQEEGEFNDNTDTPELSTFTAMMRNLAILPPENPINWQQLQQSIESVDNISVKGFYNGGNRFIYSTDNFLHLLGADELKGLTTDEAQRIKLFTYYTFRAIPLESNWEINGNYRVYSN